MTAYAHSTVWYDDVMASFWSSLFGKKQHSVLGIDIGLSSIKVVELKSQNNSIVLGTYGELSLAPYGKGDVGQSQNIAPSQIAKSLKDLLREAKVTISKAGISIPFSKSMLSLVTLPNLPPAEMQTMIPLEARKYIPVPIEEVQLDWFVLPGGKQASDKAQVLLVAVQKDALTSLDAAVQEAGVTPSFYEIEIFSTVRAVVDEPTKPVMVIDVGASTTNTYIVERGIVVASHRMARGGQSATMSLSASMNLPFAQAEDVKKKYGLLKDGIPTEYKRESVELVYSSIFSESRRVLVSYETSAQKTVSAIILTGGGGVLKNVAPLAESIFSYPISIADPFKKVSAPAFMVPVLKEIGAEFSVALGLALRELEELAR